MSKVKHRHPSRWVVEENKKIAEVDRKHAEERHAELNAAGCKLERIPICRCFGCDKKCADFIAGHCPVNGTKEADHE